MTKFRPRPVIHKFHHSVTLPTNIWVSHYANYQDLKEEYEEFEELYPLCGVTFDTNSFIHRGLFGDQLLTMRSRAQSSPTDMKRYGNIEELSAAVDDLWLDV